jgi:hypothetical protein
VLLVLACSSANATLISRAGGLAYWNDDPAANLTWVADANLAQTSGYDAVGRMSWTAAVAWIASLNAQNGGLGYLGVNNWRLPTVTDTGTSGCNRASTGTDCGYNVDLATGEMARMFYGTLGNTGEVNTSGVVTGCSDSSPHCLTNDGPFSNLQPGSYWSGTEYAPDTSNAWVFDFSYGLQDYYSKTNALYAWAVRPGDIAAVPAPAAVWLLATGLAGLGGRRLLRRAMTALG